jgi:predicted RNA binding protein YcfA (HicA-like mRNA interferase family)
MKTSNAVKKLESNGFKIVTNGSFYSAKKDDVLVTFTSTNGKTKTNGFSWASGSSCAETFGLTLAQVV